GLDRDQRAERARRANDRLRDEPWVHLSVVGVDQDPFAAGILTPGRNLLHLAQILVARGAGRGRAGREDSESEIIACGKHWLISRGGLATVRQYARQPARHTCACARRLVRSVHGPGAGRRAPGRAARGAPTGRLSSVTEQ